MIQMNYLQNRKRLTNIKNKLIVAERKHEGDRIIREFGMDMYTLPCLQWITNKDQP